MLYRIIGILVLCGATVACSTRSNLAPVEDIDHANNDLGPAIVHVTPPPGEPVETAPRETRKVAQKPEVQMMPGPVIPEEPAVSSQPASKMSLQSRTSAWTVPVKGGYVVTSYNLKSKGIDISTENTDTPVIAASNGTVVYCGPDISGSGNLVIIKHSGDYMTAYGNVSDIKVKEGDTVSKGQAIATVNFKQANLHFEIRQQGNSLNPDKFYTIK